MHITAQIKEKEKSQKLGVLPAFTGPLTLTFFYRVFLWVLLLMGAFSYGYYLYMSAEFCC